MGLLNILFPKYCVNCRKLGAYICANCFSFISFDVAMICLVCNRGSFDGLTHPKCRKRFAIDGAFAAVSYKGIVRKLIYNFKYKPFLSDLRDSLVDLFYESIIQNEVFVQTLEQLNNRAIVLTPVPLHWIRFNKRGYNHAQLLAKGLSFKLNIPFIELLKRVKATKSQFGLNLKKRKENISDSFVITPNIPIFKHPNIFLIDDILTTGSTLLEAARILKKNGAKKVWGLALARD